MNLHGHRDSASRALVPIVLAAGLLVVVAVASVTVSPLQDIPVALCFAALILLGEVVRITLPGDRESAPLAAAGALAYALLPTFNGQAMTYGVAQVVAVVTVASLLGTLPHLVAGRTVRLEDLARRIITVTVVAAAFRPLLDGHLGRSTTWQLATVMTLVALLGALVDNTLAAFVRSARDHAPYVRTWLDEGSALFGIGSAISATGVLIALAAGQMGALALVVFSVPLLLAQFSFRRYAAIRATYSQTIRSLARVTDVGGYTDTGHAHRVERLAVAVGRELGLSEKDLLDLSYAALMHDIGQLSLQDPIPGGATSLAPQEMQSRIADLGAEVISQASVMATVAVIVRRQSDPYRPRPGVIDDTLPLESRIIRACNGYDDLVGSSFNADRQAQALERLRLGCRSDFDERVVDSLGRVVSHRLVHAY